MMSLFSKKKDESQATFVNKGNSSQKGITHLGKNLLIKGTISGDDNLRIEGNLEGDIQLRSTLSIGQTAKIKGQIKADVINASGFIDGKLEGKSKIHLDQTSRIDGLITTPKLSVQEGAVFNGEIKMSAKTTKAFGTPESAKVPETTPIEGGKKKKNPVVSANPLKP